MKLHFNYLENIPTPALLINEKIVIKNLTTMQDLANKNKVNLRPHTKTHRTPEIARMQMDYGSRGITVATTGEAECMHASGIQDIFIANEIADEEKLLRLRRLMALGCDLKVGVDNSYHVEMAQSVFDGSKSQLKVLIEIDVGDGRAGVQNFQTAFALANQIKRMKNLEFSGIFSHEGQSYGAATVDECRSVSNESHLKTVEIADQLRTNGVEVKTVSVGSTPSILTASVEKGVTEIRPGTYPLMDASQAAVINSFNSCAATVLATVISKPVKGRVVLNAGAKAITGQIVRNGITKNFGFGYLKDYHVWVNSFFDEHTVIINDDFYSKVKIGEKIEIIPNHICPAVNLYDYLYLINEDGYKKIIIECRGKSV